MKTVNINNSDIDYTPGEYYQDDDTPGDDPSKNKEFQEMKKKLNPPAG